MAVGCERCSDTGRMQQPVDPRTVAPPVLGAARPPDPTAQIQLVECSACAGRPDLAWLAGVVSSDGTRGMAAMVDTWKARKIPWDIDFVLLLREAIQEELVILEGMPRPTHRYLLTDRGRQFVRQTATRGTVLA